MKVEKCQKCSKPIIIVSVGNEPISRGVYNSLALSLPGHLTCIDCEKVKEEKVDDSKQSTK